MGYLDKALETMQQQREQVVNHDLLDATLREIGGQYKPGLIRWIREHPDQWRELIALEDRIDEVAQSNQDETILKDALADYRLFFVEMTELYVKGDTLPLFGGTR